MSGVPGEGGTPGEPSGAAPDALAAPGKSPGNPALTMRDAPYLVAGTLFVGLLSLPTARSGRVAEALGEWVGRLILTAVLASLVGRVKKDRILSRWFFWIAILVFAFSPREKPDSLSALSRQAEAANKTLPEMLTKDLQFARVDALEGVLINEYRFINHTADELDLAQMRATEPERKRTVCASPLTQAYLKNGVTIRTVFRDRTNAVVAGSDIRPSDCGLPVAGH